MTDEIRGLTVWQPWASLLARGLKQFETRAWATDYRGELLIHAAARPVTEVLPTLEGHTVALINDLLTLEPRNYPTGCIIARAQLVDCIPMTLKFMRHVPLDEHQLGEWRAGRWAWQLCDVELLDEPIPYRGQQGLWCPTSGVLKAVGA